MIGNEQKLKTKDELPCLFYADAAQSCSLASVDEERLENVGSVQVCHEIVFGGLPFPELKVS